MSRSAPPLEVSAPRRAVIAQVAADPAVSARDAVHARVLLAAADGVTNVDNARRHGVSVGTVSAWRRAFEAEGLAGFGQVRPGRGRRGTIPGLTLGEVIQAVGRNDRSPHPVTARELAVHLGVSEGTLRRVRCDLGLVRGADGRQELPGPPLTPHHVEVCGLKVTPEGLALAVSLDPLSHTRLVEVLDGDGVADGAVGTAGGTAGGALSGARGAERGRRLPTPVLVLIAALEVMQAAVGVLGGEVAVSGATAPGSRVDRHHPRYAGGLLEDLATRVPSALRILVVSADYSWPSVPDDRVHLREVARESWLSEVARVLRPLGVGVAGRSQFACLEDLVGAVDDHFGEGLREGEDFDWRAVRDHLIAGPLRSRLDLLTRTEFF